ncbi:hypothetical protein GALL_525340 [mine drainage metagenome]|uniref:Uncharacterized protein n=1 Tax=mine drainage metagenome TaxID=410659 RepID=A0A1J5PDK2_9ZZZZ
MAQGAGGNQPVQTVNATFQPRRPMACFQYNILEQRACYEIAPDDRFDVRMTSQQRPGAVEHSYRGAFSEGHGRKEVFELGQLYGSNNETQEVAIRRAYLTSQFYRPSARDSAFYRIAQNRCPLRVRFERFEIIPAGVSKGRGRP